MKSKIEEVYELYKKINDKILQFENYTDQLSDDEEESNFRDNSTEGISTQKEVKISGEESTIEEGQILLVSKRTRKSVAHKKRIIAVDYLRFLADSAIAEVSELRKGETIPVAVKDDAPQEKLKQLERKYMSRNTLGSISEKIEINPSNKLDVHEGFEKGDPEEPQKEELQAKQSSEVTHVDLKEPVKEGISPVVESLKEEHTDPTVTTHEQAKTVHVANNHFNEESNSMKQLGTTDLEKSFVHDPHTFEKDTSVTREEDKIVTPKEDKTVTPKNDRETKRESDLNQIPLNESVEVKASNSQNNSLTNSMKLNKRNKANENLQQEQQEQNSMIHPQYPHLGESPIPIHHEDLQKSQSLLGSQKGVPVILMKNKSFVEEEETKPQPKLSPAGSSKALPKQEMKEARIKTPHNDQMPTEYETSPPYQQEKIPLTLEKASPIHNKRPSQALLDFLATDFASQAQKTESANLKEHIDITPSEHDWFQHRTRTDPLYTVPTQESRIDRETSNISSNIITNTNEETYTPLFPTNGHALFGRNPMQKNSNGDEANSFKTEELPLHLILKQRIPTDGEEEMQPRGLNPQNGASLVTRPKSPQNESGEVLLNQSDAGYERSATFGFVSWRNNSEGLLQLESPADSHRAMIFKHDASNEKLHNYNNKNSPPSGRTDYFGFLKGFHQTSQRRASTIQKEILEKESKNSVISRFEGGLYSNQMEVSNSNSLLKTPNRIALKNNPLTNQISPFEEAENEQGQLFAKPKMSWVAKQIFSDSNQKKRPTLSFKTPDRQPKHSESKPSQTHGLMLYSIRQKPSDTDTPKEEPDKPVDFRKLLGIK